MTRSILFVGTFGVLVGLAGLPSCSKSKCEADCPLEPVTGGGGVATAGQSGGGGVGGAVAGAGGGAVAGAGGGAFAGAGGTGGAGQVSGGGAGGPASGVGGSGAFCGQLTRTLSSLPPDILILLDRSGSMDNDINDRGCADAGIGTSVGGCGAGSKWALVTTVLNQVVAQTDASVNWGLKFFADPGNATCTVSGGVQVPVGPGNAAAITAAIASETNPAGGSATAAARPRTRPRRAPLSTWAR